MQIHFNPNKIFIFNNRRFEDGKRWPLISTGLITWLGILGLFLRVVIVMTFNSIWLDGMLIISIPIRCIHIDWWKSNVFFAIQNIYMITLPKIVYYVVKSWRIAPSFIIYVCAIKCQSWLIFAQKYTVFGNFSRLI